MSGLQVADVIAKKARGGALTGEEIEFLVQRVVDKQMDQVQLGAMLMAVYIRGMGKEETTRLTAAMTRSGRVLTWPQHWLVVDKHSTGGVGDKVSLPLAPALAACGFKVPMVSGRGLGHTGGTLDKLEAIPGFTVSQSAEQMYQCLEEVGCCIVGQTAELVPADRILYANRDITNTVDSIPLITSSIISKKAAEGLRALVLDVKYGAGAVMKERQQARELAQWLVDTSNRVGVSTAALLTNMESPIGRSVGNALEVAETVQCLRGAGPSDMLELVTSLGGQLVALSGQGSAEVGRERLQAVLTDGSALDKFRQMLEAQGVSSADAQELCHGDPWKVLTSAPRVESVAAPTVGYVSGVDAMAVAQLCGALGAGRRRVDDKIDHSVGVTFSVGLGDRVEAGQTWAQVHHSGSLSEEGRAQLQAALTLSSEPVTVAPRVTELVEGR